MSEPSLEEKIVLILMKSAQDAGFGQWEGRESIPMAEFEKVFEKFSNNLVENLKKVLRPRTT